MKKFRYNLCGAWFKGNTHIHSTASDGGKKFAEIEDLYSAAGYDFLFRTDHWVLSDIGTGPDDGSLLWIDGVELDGHDHTGAFFHVVCLGAVKHVAREAGLAAGLEAARDQGALLVLAHPYWTGNSLEDGVRHRFDGIEIYNHVCHWLNGKSCGLVHWNHALLSRPATLAFAVDDAHLRPEHPGWDGGWIMVNAANRSRESLLESIKRGNFYSSCGPSIYEMEWDGDALRLTTSPVRVARVVGPRSQGHRAGALDGQLLTEFKIRVPAEWDYVYAEIEDLFGRRAWTNTLFNGMSLR